MTTWEAIALGIVQGLTEFLPVSSSGHEVLAARLLGLDLPGAQKQAWVILVHVASAAAIAGFFAWEWWRHSWREVAAEGAAPHEGSDAQATAGASMGWIGWFRWAFYLGLGTVPAGLAYLAFQSFFDDVAFRHIELVGLALLANASLLLFVDRLKPNGQLRVGLTPFRSRHGMQILLIGVAQAFALLPGISRSGSTICAALLVGVERSEAVRFSFALGFVAILAATGKLVLEGAGVAELHRVLGLDVLIAGFLASLLTSIASLWLLLALVRRIRLVGFAVYCAAVGTATLVVAALGLAT